MIDHLAKEKVPHPTKWWGGKSYLAKKLIPLFPKHVHYVEPYFGGGAVLLEKDPEGVSEVVNDLNGELTNFWTVLRIESAFTEFMRYSEATPFSETEFLGCKACEPIDADTIAMDMVGSAWNFFVRCRQSRAGQFKSFATLSKSRTRRGMNEQASSWLTAIEGLPAVHARLKRVVILNSPALEVIRREDTPDTFFYLDPPYLHETRSGSKETKDDYAHEMSVDDHARLMAALSKIKGKFALSGYPSKLYRDFAEQFDWRRVDFEIDNKAAGGEKKRKMIECVWMNYGPSLAKPA